MAKQKVSKSTISLQRKNTRKRQKNLPASQRKVLNANRKRKS
jgi:hypothetical protein